LEFHLPALGLGHRFSGLTFGFLQVGQLELGHAENVCLEALPNELASAAKPGKMDPAWNVSEEICERSFLSRFLRAGG
jgi:hypothetical protein